MNTTTARRRVEDAAVILRAQGRDDLARRLHNMAERASLSHAAAAAEMIEAAYFASPSLAAERSR